MKKTVIQLSIWAFALGLTTNVSAQDVDKKILNWYNGKAGMQTEKAYKKVKNRKSETVVVAIIDSGIDTDHEDLKGQIWVNADEIPNNGIDDDNNGYIDDVNGWNFLGNEKGENANDMRLERTRIYAELRKKYEDKEFTIASEEDAKEFELFRKVKKELAEERAKYEGYLQQVSFIPMIMKQVPSAVEKAIGKKDYTMKDLKKWKPKDPQSMQMKGLAMAMKSGRLTEESINKQKEQIENMLATHHNPDFNGRTLIGDNPNDINDTKYGNNDVEGPDALHGTHVGGIVGALRGNGLGGDGVAENVKLMSLRAVPNGDEFDKDIALAIRYAVDNGAQIINMSFGKSYSPMAQEVFDAFKYADEKGVLLVHAAGNDNKNIDEKDNFPTSNYAFQDKKLDHFLTIGASTRYGKKDELAAEFSNYGSQGVDVFAPGLEIYNTVQDGKYKAIQGTSMACPMVSGAAAFLKSYFPKLSMLDIKEILLETATNHSGESHVKPGGHQANGLEPDMVDFGTLSVTGGTINLFQAVKMCLDLEKMEE